MQTLYRYFYGGIETLWTAIVELLGPHILQIWVGTILLLGAMMLLKALTS